MAGINDFKQALKGGGARANQFEVVVEFPAFAGGSEEIRKTQFLVKATRMPGSTIGVTEVPFRGRTLKLAGDREFAEWSATFLNDIDFAVRDAFERWSNTIVSHVDNVGINSPDEYMSTISVYQLNRQGNRIKEYVLHNVWPSIIGEIEVAQDSNNLVEEFEVTFQYSEWTANTTS